MFFFNFYLYEVEDDLEIDLFTTYQFRKVFAVIQPKSENSGSGFGLFQSLPRLFRWTGVTETPGTRLKLPLLSINRCVTDVNKQRFHIGVITQEPLEVLTRDQANRM